MPESFVSPFFVNAYQNKTACCLVIRVRTARVAPHLAARARRRDLAIKSIRRSRKIGQASLNFIAFHGKLTTG